jgi:hypothetical protein
MNRGYPAEELTAAGLQNAEHRLYRTPYNALIRRLVSFERAAECAR